MLEPTATAEISNAARRPRIALAHDWLVGMRGGERVLDTIARIVRRQFTPARLYTMFDDGRAMSTDIDAFEKTSSFLNRLPDGPGRTRRWLLPLYPMAVRDLSRQLANDHAREPIDLLISTSSAAIKGLRPPPGVPHVCYCHSPARYLWSQGDAYSRTSAMVRLGLAVTGPMLRRWDAATAANVTTFIANSNHIKREIARCYRREAIVIHPPVRTDFFTPDPAVEREDFWLAVGAIEPYKQFDLAISAAKSAGARLVIIGEGTLRRSLERKAGSHVEFRGRVSDEALRDAYRRARLLVFPQIEDFGIIAVEAQACGCPIVAGRAGGAMDIVQDGVTGAMFDDPSPQAVATAAKRATGLSPSACWQRARNFAETRFEARMIASIHATTPIGPAGGHRDASTEPTACNNPP